MEYVAIMLAGLMTLATYRKEKSIMAPSVVFNALWTFVYFFIVVNLGNYFKISTSAYMIMLTGQIAFGFGSSLNVRFKLGDFQRNAIDAPFILPPWFVFLQLVVIALMLPFLGIALSTILNSGFGSQRYNFATNETLLFTNLQRYLYIYLIVFPINKALCLLCVGEVFQKKKITLKFIIAILGIALETIITAGRFAIVDIAFCFLAIFFIYVKGDLVRKDKKKIKRIVFYIILLVLIAGMIVSASRTKREDSHLSILLSNFVDYFTIGPRLLDLALEQPEVWGLSDWGLGGFTFAGLLEIVRLVFAFIGIPVGLTFFGDSQSVAGLYHVISSTGKRANAFPTMYYYFIRDFSFAGVIIIPFIFGIVCRAVYRYIFIKERSIWRSLLYGYLLLLVFYSSCWWQAIRPEYWTTLIWLICLYKIFIHKKSRKVKIGRI